MKYLRMTITEAQAEGLERKRKAREEALPGQRVTLADLVRAWAASPEPLEGASQGAASASKPPRSAPTTHTQGPATPLTGAPRASLHERLEAIARHAAAPAPPELLGVESVYDRMLAKRDAFGPAFDPEKLPADEREAYLEVFTPSGVKK